MGKHLEYLFYCERAILAELKRVPCSFAETFSLPINMRMAFGFVSVDVRGACVSV